MNYNLPPLVFSKFLKTSGYSSQRAAWQNSGCGGGTVWQPLFSAPLDAKASKSVGKKIFDAAVSVGTACLFIKDFNADFISVKSNNDPRVTHNSR